MSQKPENTDEKTISQCGELCDDGTRCERRQKAETCYLHDPDQEAPDDHGGPAGNTNAVTHGLGVDTERFVHEVLESAEAVHLFTIYEGLLRSSEYEFDIRTETVEIDGQELARPVATENSKRARDLFRAAVGLTKQRRAKVTEIANDGLSEDGTNVSWLNAALSTLSGKVASRMDRGGVSGLQ